VKKITYDIEWNLEKSHWWFVGRRKLIRFLISSSNTWDEHILLDIGCGVGSNLSLFSSMGFKSIGMDSEIYGLLLVKRRLSGVPLVNGDLMRLPFKCGSLGLIIATDVLEHLDDDTIGIKEIYRTLKKNGKAIFTVPAFGFLWGVQDIVGMHKRRYLKKELVSKIEKEGFKILRSSYFNLFLFFPILLVRSVIHLLGLSIKSENEINSPFLNSLLKGVFSLEASILKYFSFPFGVSIFCIAKK